MVDKNNNKKDQNFDNVKVQLNNVTLNKNEDNDKYFKLIEKMQKKVKLAISKIPFIEIKRSYFSFSFNEVREAKEVFEINFLILEVLISTNLFFKFVLLYQEKDDKKTKLKIITEIENFIGDAKDMYGIVVAPFLKENTIETYKKYGIGSIDFKGNIFLSFKNVYVDKKKDFYIRDTDNSELANESLKPLFSPKSSRVFREMLSNPFKKFYVRDLSKITGISMGLVSRIKREMLANEWVKEYKKAFFIEDIETAELMLNEWAKNYLYEKYSKFHYFFCKYFENKNRIKDIIIDERLKLKSFCEKNNYIYALTLFSGAYEVLKNIPDNEKIYQDKLFFYIKYVPLSDTSKIDALYDLKMEFDLVKVSPSKANFIVLEESKNTENLKKEGDDYEEETSLDEDYTDKLGKDVFYKIQTVKNEFKNEPGSLIKYETKVVSDIQLYLDLHKFKGGAKIAQRILEERIKPDWIKKEKNS